MERMIAPWSVDSDGSCVKTESASPSSSSVSHSTSAPDAATRSAKALCWLAARAGAKPRP
jgi:hypothetical protein